MSRGGINTRGESPLDKPPDRNLLIYHHKRHLKAKLETYNKKQAQALIFVVSLLFSQKLKVFAKSEPKGLESVTDFEIFKGQDYVTKNRICAKQVFSNSGEILVTSIVETFKDFYVETLTDSSLPFLLLNTISNYLLQKNDYHYCPAFPLPIAPLHTVRGGSYKRHNAEDTQ